MFKLFISYKKCIILIFSIKPEDIIVKNSFLRSQRIPIIDQLVLRILNLLEKMLPLSFLFIMVFSMQLRFLYYINMFCTLINFLF